MDIENKMKNIDNIKTSMSSSPIISAKGGTVGQSKTQQQASSGATKSTSSSTTGKKKKRWTKPVGKPKRPLSAYNIFFKEQRVIMKRQQEIEQQQQYHHVAKKSPAVEKKVITFSSMGKTIANRWNSLSIEERQPYMAAAMNEALKYKVNVTKWKNEQEAKRLLVQQTVEQVTAAAASSQQQQQSSSGAHHDYTTTSNALLSSPTAIVKTVTPPPSGTAEGTQNGHDIKNNNINKVASAAEAMLMMVNSNSNSSRCTNVEQALAQQRLQQPHAQQQQKLFTLAVNTGASSTRPSTTNASITDAPNNNKINISPYMVMPKLLDEKYKPSVNDVICGQQEDLLALGGSRSAGNDKFYKLVVSSRDKYFSCSSNENDQLFVLRLIVSLVRQSYNGKFIDIDDATGQWYDIGDILAMEKIKQIMTRSTEEKQKQEEGTSSSKQEKVQEDFVVDKAMTSTRTQVAMKQEDQEPNGRSKRSTTTSGSGCSSGSQSTGTTTDDISMMKEIHNKDEEIQRLNKEKELIMEELMKTKMTNANSEMVLLQEKRKKQFEMEAQRQHYQAEQEKKRQLLKRRADLLSELSQTDTALLYECSNDYGTTGAGAGTGVAPPPTTTTGTCTNSATTTTAKKGPPRIISPRLLHKGVVSSPILSCTSGMDFQHQYQKKQRMMTTAMAVTPVMSSIASSRSPLDNKNNFPPIPLLRPLPPSPMLSSKQEPPQIKLRRRQQLLQQQQMSSPNLFMGTSRTLHFGRY